MMNIQEREQLTHFLQQLEQARVNARDAEADALIKESFSRQPEAAYLLVQRSMLQDQALKSAQAQSVRLQAELDSARLEGRNGSFLGDTSAWGNVAPSPGRSPLGAFAPAAAPAQTGPGGGWGSSWLGSVATTAAGVVAGSFLFQGIEHLMGNQNRGWMSGESGLQPQAPVTDNTVVNNYYDGAASTGAENYDVAALDADITDDVGDVI